MAAKTPLAVNISFKMAPLIAGPVVQTVGDPLTDTDEVAIWFAASVLPAKRQSNVGVIRNIQRFIHDNFTVLGAAAPDIVHATSIFGSTGNDCEINGVPAVDQINIEIGNDLAGNSHMIDVSITKLLQAYLEASTGN